MVCLNPQSRYQVTNVLADQSFGDDQVRYRSGAQHVVTGAEISRETVSLDTYTGLNSEASAPAPLPAAPSVRSRC